METMDIPVIKVKRSRLAEMDFDDLPFGKYFSDHMLEADYADGEWKLVSIKPYQPISFEPSLMALHYGQSFLKVSRHTARKTAKLLFFVPTIT